MVSLPRLSSLVSLSFGLLLGAEALAQTNPALGDRHNNLDDHLARVESAVERGADLIVFPELCLLYTSPSPRDRTRSRMPSSA